MTSLFPSPKTIFPVLLFAFLACNPATEQNIKSDEKTGPLADTPTQAAAVAPLKEVELPKFKITKDFLLDLQKTNKDAWKAKKFICQVKFIYGFSQPGGMHLLAFPASNHAHYARNTRFFEMTETDGTVKIDLEGIAFGNMEIDWNNMIGVIWNNNQPKANFSHIILSPYINADKQLGYDVSFFDTNNQPFPLLDDKGSPVTYSFRLNPSPPAEPNE